ncbi:MAG: cell division protein FtsL [Methylohalobius sp.]|nr:cell division protein FtsL [Methylohalobius sp.]
MLSKAEWVCVGLSILVAGSAVGVVYGKYQSRLLFNEVQRLQAQLDACEVEWEQLLLEEHAWADLTRIERLAQVRLHMAVPKADEIAYLPLVRWER